jgi:hypothetical protein
VSKISGIYFASVVLQYGMLCALSIESVFYGSQSRNVENGETRKATALADDAVATRSSTSSNGVFWEVTEGHNYGMYTPFCT